MFKIGDRVVVVPCSGDNYNRVYKREMGEHLVIDRVGATPALYICGSIAFPECVLVLESVYNSPVYKMLKEEK